MSNNIFYYDLTYKELTRKLKSPSAKAKGLEIVSSPDRTILELFV
jgi:hypothetical protein